MFLILDFTSLQAAASQEEPEDLNFKLSITVNRHSLAPPFEIDAGKAILHCFVSTSKQNQNQNLFSSSSILALNL